MPEVVVDFGPPPRAPFHLPHLPGFGSRSSKLITASAAIVISISLVSFTIFSVATNNSDFKKKHGITTAADQAQATSGSSKSLEALPGGGVATGIGGTSGTNAPVVTLTSQPASVTVGNKTHLKWSVTNNPKSCIASDDWSGNKPTSGEEDTPSLTKVQTYIFTLTCKTSTGTGFATVSVGATEQGGTGNVATRPTVTLATNPTSTYTGLTSTLSWSVSNNPNICKASGDWSGDKTPEGAEATPALKTTKKYTYTLTCTNSAGTGFATATVQTLDPPPDVPIVTMYSTPVSPVTIGTDTTINWSVNNNPTSCTASGNWSGSKGASGSFKTGALNTIKAYSYTLTCGNASGSTSTTVDITVVPNRPVVSLSVSPSSTTTGTPVTISWSATNSPTSCTASGDWSGSITPTSSGTRSFTPSSAKTYLFSLSCTNAGGDGFQNNIPLTVTNPAAPVVTISTTPISVTTGGSANITWSATNNPTSCTAGGTGWSGTKAKSGTQSTGALNTIGTFTYSLSCSNAGGTGSASTSVSVSSGTTTSPPVVTMSASPTSIGTGSSSTISWSATNSPTSCTASGTGWSGSKGASGTQSTGAMNTAGTFTYTLSCSNSAGSGSKSVTLTVVAVPSVTISVNPVTITAGASATATVTWSATNTPTSCTASGSWTGTKAASGTTTVGPITSAGTYTYTLTCANTGGTGPSKSTTLTATPPVVVYCSGNTICYGPNDLKQHVTATNCWAYNTNRVINVTSLNNGYHNKGRGNLLPSGYTGVCGNVNLAPFISGSSSIPSIGTHNHASSTKGNTGTVSTYLQGWYDATKP